MTGVPWNDLLPNQKNAWLTEGLQADYDDLLPIGSKETKTQKALEVKAIFKNYGRGVSTCRDEWAYDFDRGNLEAKMVRFISSYNAEVVRWKQCPDKEMLLDTFVNNDSTVYKWSETLKQNLKRGAKSDFIPALVRPALPRPFCKQWLYFDGQFIERVYQMPAMFSAKRADVENLLIGITDLGSEKPFMALATNQITDLHLVGAGASTQCFPLYTYALDGKLRRDNVTDWALGQFQAKYGPDVTKRDIFHYVYGLLHSPQYRERYKENLKRELPRVPLVGPTPGASADPSLLRKGEDGGEGNVAGDGFLPSLDRGGSALAPGRGPFRAFVEAGAALAALHVGYEQAAEYPLTLLVNKDVLFSWRVTKMRLNKEKTAVIVNEALTLAGVPPEAFGYRLGSRSALDWVLDQYQVSTDKRSGIVTDPNRADDPEYIVRLVRRVVTVSVETVRLVAGLPPLFPPT